MKTLLSLLVIAVAVIPLHATPDFELDLKAQQREIKKTAAGSKKTLAKESSKASPKIVVNTIAIYAATEERAEAIEKLVREKYCKQTACTTVILREMGFHPSERNLFDQLVRAEYKKIQFIGLDDDMSRLGGADIKLRQLRARGSVIQSVTFTGEDGKGPIEVCDASAGDPGCGGD